MYFNTTYRAATIAGPTIQGGSTPPPRNNFFKNVFKFIIKYFYNLLLTGYLFISQV